MSEHKQTQQSKKQDSTFQKRSTLINQTAVSHPASIIQRARIDPKSLTPADVLQLQRTIGNRAVGKLLSEIRNQSKVQRAPIQRQKLEHEEICPSCMQKQEIPEEEEPLQGKMIEPVQRQEIPEEEEPLQGKMIETIQRQEIPEEEEPLQPKRENNTGMPDNLKAGVENLSGIDMSDVRVHYNSEKPADVGALAYTQGIDIHVAPGQERHLPHEAWHVVQQKQGRVRPTMQLKEEQINVDIGLEREADMMGIRALNSENDFVDGKNNLRPYLYNNMSIQRKMICKGYDRESEARIRNAWLQVESYYQVYAYFFNNSPFDFVIEGTNKIHPAAKAETIRTEKKIIIYNLTNVNNGQLLRLITHELEHMSRTEWNKSGDFAKDLEEESKVRYHDILLKFEEGEEDKNENLLKELRKNRRFITMFEYITEMMHERITILSKFDLNEIVKNKINAYWVFDVMNGLNKMKELGNKWMEIIMVRERQQDVINFDQNLEKVVKLNISFIESTKVWHNTFNRMLHDMERSYPEIILQIQNYSHRFK